MSSSDIIVGTRFAPDSKTLTRAVKRVDGPTVAFLLVFTFLSQISGEGEENVLFQVKDEHILTAVAKGELQLLDLLVQAKGNVDATNETGDRPLLITAESRNALMVE